MNEFIPGCVLSPSEPSSSEFPSPGSKQTENSSHESGALTRWPLRPCVTPAILYCSETQCLNLPERVSHAEVRHCGKLRGKTGARVNNLQFIIRAGA
jgi:hypothetical protein